MKWNLRTTPVQTIAQARVADGNTALTVFRPSKHQYLWEQGVAIRDGNESIEARRV